MRPPVDAPLPPPPPMLCATMPIASSPCVVMLPDAPTGVRQFPLPSDREQTLTVPPLPPPLPEPPTEPRPPEAPPLPPPPPMLCATMPLALAPCVMIVPVLVTDTVSPALPVLDPPPIDTTPPESAPLPPPPPML